MKHFTVLAITMLSIVLAGVPAWAQLSEPNQIGVTTGHIRLVVKDVDAQKHFGLMR